MPHCGALAGPSDVAHNATSAVSHERAGQDTPELTHGLALTNFLDCNTRHSECSTCFCFGARKHNRKTTTATTPTMKRAGTERRLRHGAGEVVSRYLSKFTGTLPLPIYCT